MKKILSILTAFILTCSLAHAYTEQVQSFGSAWTSSTPSTSANSYSIVQGDNSWNTTETRANPPVPANVTVSRLLVDASGSPGSGKSYVLTLRKNEVDTALTCTISDAATSCSDTSNSVSFTAGDRMDVECTPSGTPTAAAISGTVIIADSSDTGISITQFHSTSNLSQSATQYSLVHGGSNYQNTQTIRDMVVSTSGTFKNLYVDLDSSPGSGKSYTFTLYKNASSTALTCSIADANTTCNDTTHTVTAAAGDLFSIESVPSGTPSAMREAHGLVFKADTDGYFLIPAPGASGPSTSATVYNAIAGSRWASGLAESNTDFPHDSFTVKNFYYNVDTAPSSGKSYTLTLRSNAGDSALAVTLSDTNTTVSATTDVAVSQGDKLDVKSVPSGTPTANGAMSTCFTGYRVVSSGARRRVIIFD